MQQTVGVAAARLNAPSSSSPVLQNLGPGIVYVDHDSGVSEDTGFKLVVNAVYEFPRDLGVGGGNLWVVADAADTDLRILVVG